MNLWNKLTSLFSKKATVVTAEETTPTETHTVKCSCSDVFVRVCAEAGVGKHVKKVNGVELVEEWDDGPCDEESVRAAIAGFKEEHPAVAAKMAGKL